MINHFWPHFSVGFYKYSYASLSNLLSSWFRYEALKLVSFTTVIIVKGSRLFPIMFVNKLMKKTKFHPLDWLTAFFLCSGSIVYMKFKDLSHDEDGLDASLSGLRFSNKFFFVKIHFSSHLKVTLKKHSLSNIVYIVRFIHVKLSGKVVRSQHQGNRTGLWNIILHYLTSCQFTCLSKWILRGDWFSSKSWKDYTSCDRISPLFSI